MRTALGPSSTPLRADLRERVRYVDAATTPLEELLSGADVFVAASAGAEPRPGAARARRRRPASSRVAARLPVYEEVLGDGERGLLFERARRRDARRAARRA